MVFSKSSFFELKQTFFLQVDLGCQKSTLTRNVNLSYLDETNQKFDSEDNALAAFFGSQSIATFRQFLKAPLLLISPCVVVF